MQYKFAIPTDKCVLVNPHGRMAICTLWTPPMYILEKLKAMDPDTVSKNSPLTLIGGLFGGGLKIMLRNLIYNPQIETVVIFGKDMSESGIHLSKFFHEGERATGTTQQYTYTDGSVDEIEQVVVDGDDIQYTMDGLVRLAMFTQTPHVITIATSQVTDVTALVEYIRNYTVRTPLPDEGSRIHVPLPELVVDTFPNDIRAHSVVGTTVFDAWRQLLVKLNKFGNTVHLRDGKERNELQNMKVVIQTPQDYTDSDLQQYNLSTRMIRDYQASLLDPTAPTDGKSYTYGYRLGHYGDPDVTPIDHVIRDLSIDMDSRHAYITLWNNHTDISGASAPCLVSLFFRKVDRDVHLTANFRTHNGTNAWPKNALGILGILEHVCTEVNKLSGHGLSPATITIISHSISIDKSDLPNVQTYIDDELVHGKTVKLDPHGYLQISISPEDMEIVVHHFSPDNEELNEYRGKKPQMIQDQLYRNNVLSDIGHAMYVGGQLERACICLHNDLEYKQDKTILIRE